MIGAIAVATVLIVGGALLFLTDTDERDDTAGSASSDSVIEVFDADPSPDPNSTPAPTTEAADAVTGESIVTEAPPVTVSPPSEPLVSVAPAPVTPVPVAPIPVTAPPVTAPPPTAAPTVAPQPAPGPALTFEQADGFFRNYVALAASGDYTTAWSVLSSSDQADYPDGFDQFVGFWRSVSFADVQRVESVGGSAGFQSLMVDMAYGQADGDPTSFEIIEVDVNVRPDGSLQIFDYRYIRNQ